MSFTLVKVTLLHNFWPYGSVIVSIK